jgi:uncharacterized protein YdeI (YjbR/CyaY-like superfamily)
MGKKNPKVDAYIDQAGDFAKPVLIHLRELVHKACPGVEENMKWNMPSFEYKGMLCGFASFKQHCTFGFRKAALMKDAGVLLGKQSKEAMGNLGCITSIKDLPSDKRIIRWIKEAMKLNEAGVKVPPKKTKHKKKPLRLPRYFIYAVKKNKKAWTVFEKFSPGNKRDYVEWITEAKTDDTRQKRLKQAIEWMADGKPHNWRYMKKYR